MKVCSKCKINKEDNQYYTYFHSTFKKHYTRNICFDCINYQKKQYKLKLKQMNSIENNPNYKKCKSCNKYKLLKTEFYKSITSYQATCKECASIRGKQKRRDEYESKGGSHYYYQKPNEFIDDFQKQQVFMIMEVLGWKQNKDGVWYDNKIKMEDGTWPKVKKPIRTRKSGKRECRTSKLTYEAILEYRRDGLTYDEIGMLYGVSGPAIRLKRTKYERKN